MGTNSKGHTPEERRKLEEYYEACRLEAEEFQDFVVDVCLERLGLAIVQYTSRKYQFEIGESRTGVEIKKDRKYAETGRLFIETEERKFPWLNYTASGIYRKDNSWLYIIGNYDILYIFSKKLLRQIIAKAKLPNSKPHYDIIEIGAKTSRGFCLPKKDAERYAVEFIELNENPKAAPTAVPQFYASTECISPHADEINWEPKY